jgi:hypothetical protein
MNLTIHGVTIEGDNTGAIAGSTSGQISECAVVLTQTSLLKGSTVGGIAGSNSGYIEYCTVTSVGNNSPIQGSTIGGIVGSSTGTISNCQVKCNLDGQNNVGGIVGDLTKSIQDCGYQGNISGTDYVGGICGKFKSSYTSIIMSSCKAEAQIKAKDNIGGLVGYVEGSPEITACYSTGAITCSQSSSSKISGLFNAGWNTPSCGYCYTTVECGHANFKPLAKTESSSMKLKYSYSVYDSSIYGSKQSVDVATLLEETFAPEVENWNFDNCWTWDNKKSGSERREVKFPRLYWEQ